MTLVDEFGRAWTARNYGSADATGAGYSSDVPPGSTRSWDVLFLSQYSTLADLPSRFEVRLPVFDGRSIPEHTFTFQRISWTDSKMNRNARTGTNVYALVGSGVSKMPPVTFGGGNPRQWGMPLSLGLGVEAGRISASAYPFDWHLEFGDTQDGGGHDGRLFNGALAELEFSVTDRLRIGGGYRLHQSVLGNTDEYRVEDWDGDQPNIPFGQIAIVGHGGASYAQTNRWFFKVRAGPDFIQAYVGGGFFIR